MSRETKRIPVLSLQEMQKVWSSLSAADQEVILGHSNKELTQDDSIRLMKFLARMKNK